MRTSFVSTLIVFLLIFICSPIFAVIICLLYILKQGTAKKEHYYVLFFLLALWLAGMNATKTPASDQIAYKMMYLSVPDFSFFDALINLKVHVNSDSSESYLEPVYKAFCYIGYYLTLGNSYWYFALVTFIIYALLLYSIYHLLNMAGYNRLTIITGIIICAFFFQLFNGTVHLIRQFLASCIVLLAIIKKNETGKNPWALYILALLSHKSTILFILFCLIPNSIIEKKRNVIIIMALVAICTLFMSQLSNSLMGIGFGDSYVLSRAASDSNEFSEMNKLILYGISMPIVYICIRALMTDETETAKIRYFLFICLLLSIFVICCSKNTLFLLRYFFYLYFIMPFTIPLLIRKASVYVRPYQIAICLFMPIYFFMSFKTCIWKYADVIDILFMPYPFLINYF